MLFVAVPVRRGNNPENKQLMRISCNVMLSSYNFPPNTPMTTSNDNMSPLTNTPFSQTFQSKSLLISITFILLFALVFFLNIPLTSNPLSLSTTLTSHLFSRNTFTTPFPSLHNNTSSTRHSSGSDIVLAPEYIAPSSAQNSFVVNGSSSSCDLFDGSWVYDDDIDPVYAPGTCPLVEAPFDCFKSGRPDLGYLNYRWQPYGCDIPRFDRKRMMEMLKGKRMVFVGDSLNRNMCESLVCSLGMFSESERTFFTPNGKSFEFKNDDSSISMITAPFLVQQLEVLPGLTDRGKPRQKLQLDEIHETVSKYFDADFLIFNTGQWWIPNKVQNGEFFFQEGDVLHKKMDLEEAYTKALNTWAKWVDKNVDKNKTQVFFVGYTANHFKNRGGWKSVRGCDRETEPIKDEKFLEPYPWLMKTLETVILKMSTPVVYLNITKLTDYRKDAHPSIYRWPGSKFQPGVGQDCLHWCLPGVPDSWNQLLYASMLSSSNSAN